MSVPRGALGGWAEPDLAPPLPPDVRAVRVLAGRATAVAVRRAAAPRVAPLGPVPRWTRWRWLRRHRWLAWADANVLGGRRAYLQAVAVCQRAVRKGWAERTDREDAARAADLFPSLEAVYDESLLDSLSHSVPPVEGETPRAYDERLRATLGSLRHRLDAPPRRTPTSVPPAGARVPAPTQEVVVLTRAQAKAARKAFWALYRRSPTEAELAAWVREHAA